MLIVIQQFPVSHKDTPQDPQWMPETEGSTEPHIYYNFFYTYVPNTMFNL